MDVESVSLPSIITVKDTSWRLPVGLALLKAWKDTVNDIVSVTSVQLFSSKACIATENDSFSPTPIDSSDGWENCKNFELVIFEMLAIIFVLARFSTRIGTTVVLPCLSLIAGFCIVTLTAGTKSGVIDISWVDDDGKIFPFCSAVAINRIMPSSKAGAVFESILAVSFADRFIVLVLANKNVSSRQNESSLKRREKYLLEKSFWLFFGFMDSNFFYETNVFCFFSLTVFCFYFLSNFLGSKRENAQKTKINI